MGPKLPKYTKNGSINPLFLFRPLALTANFALWRVWWRASLICGRNFWDREGDNLPLAYAFFSSSWEYPWSPTEAHMSSRYIYQALKAQMASNLFTQRKLSLFLGREVARCFLWIFREEIEYIVGFWYVFETLGQLGTNQSYLDFRLC